MNTVRRLRAGSGLTQTELAGRAKTSQPAIAAYEAGRKSPTLATLERLAAAAGRQMDIHFHPPMTREERRSLALHEAIARKLGENPGAVVSQARVVLERMRVRHSGAARLLDLWGQLLDGPSEHLVDVLNDRAPLARELRHVTPFAGVLSARERAAVYRAFRDSEQARAR
jgi:transcriptional regulator with XRE-family HTH domain